MGGLKGKGPRKSGGGEAGDLGDQEGEMTSFDMIEDKRNESGE